MPDHELSYCLDRLVKNNKQIMKKACHIETKMAKKENRALCIATFAGLIIYLVPKLIEMVI